MNLEELYLSPDFSFHTHTHTNEPDATAGFPEHHFPHQTHTGPKSNVVCHDLLKKKKSAKVEEKCLFPGMEISSQKALGAILPDESHSSDCCHISHYRRN